MQIKKLQGEECKTTRPLWEEVFYEDSFRFTEYYFKEKAKKNTGYVIGQEPYDAMMFRTPYTLRIGEIQQEISYLVGVATRRECRHKGYMRKLLAYSMEDMYREKTPFTYLMPANPAIYEPFDFKYIYEREIWSLKEPEKMHLRLEALRKETCGEEEPLEGLYSVSNLCQRKLSFSITESLAEFANEYLKVHYHIYVHRDASYYERQIKESQAQNGDIFVWFQQGKIKAYFIYAREEEEVFLQEVIEEQEGTLEFLQKEKTKKPIIMGRIIHLEEMMKLICGEEREIVIAVRDSLLPQNTGVFHWKITSRGSQVTKISEKVEVVKSNGKSDVSFLMPEVILDIRDLTTHVLRGVFLNEIV
mgnify:CR=1 FL=1